MKKYISVVALLAAGTAFANAATTEEFAFNSAEEVITLKNEYDLTKDWTLEFSFRGDFAQSANSYGTALISSESVATAAIQKIQVYASAGTVDAPADKVVIKANNGDDSYTKSGLADGDLWPYIMYNEGLTTFTLEYDADASDLVVKCETESYGVSTEIYTATYKIMPYGTGDYADNLGTTLTQLSTGITQEQVNATNFYGELAWVLPSGTFTGTIVAPVPEPSAFGLLAGIGALALVASRRRRK